MRTLPGQPCRVLVGATPGLLRLRIQMTGLPANMRDGDDAMLHLVSDAASHSLLRALKGLPALQASMPLAIKSVHLAGPSALGIVCHTLAAKLTWLAANPKPHLPCTGAGAC